MEQTVLEQMGLIIGEWVPKAASIAVAVDNRYIFYKAGAYHLRIKEGQPVVRGSIAERAAAEKRRIEMLVDESVLGTAYFGIGYPVEIGGRQGVVVVILPPDFLVQKQEPMKFLTGKLEESWRPVPIELVSHIESSQKKTWFYTEEETYCSIHTLKNLRFSLPDCFLPVHRSYIVNINFIEEIARGIASNYQLTLKDGSVLPISQNFAGSVRAKLGF